MMIFYLLLIVGIISVLYGFFFTQLFYVGLGFAWCFAIFMLLGLFPDQLKDNDNYIRYKRQK